MTHFVGMVIHDAAETLDQLLAPFDENREVPRYRSATRDELVSGERKRIADYASPTGNYGLYLADPSAYVEGLIFGRAESEPRFNHRHLNYVARDFAAELSWNDQQCHDHAIQFEDDVDADGNTYSTYNPDSIWDWWVVGGRWSSEYVSGDRTNVGTLRSLIKANALKRDLPRVVIDRSGALRLGTEGWWGFTKDDVDEPTWRSKVLDRLEPHTDDELVTFIDLHI